ncbi:response regulator [Flavobacterium sp.]|uniref:response regulator n=1 Tax=Flavobacterium sp. TaxID=239 RepID=UPI0037AD6D0F
MANRILLVDDHLVVRTGVSIILEENFKDLTIFTAKTFPETISFVKENNVDLIILDINIPGGKNREMINDIRAFQPDVKIMMFSANDDEDYACQYIIAGANGYVNKLSEERVIVEAVDSILTKGSYFTPEIINKIVSASVNKTSINPLDNLSKREFQISELLLSGDGNIEIANKLNIQMSTVSTYKSRIFEKLNVKNLVELISVFKKLK